MAAWLTSMGRRVRAWFAREQWDQDVQDEMAFHLAMREASLRRRGIADARAGARRQFGNTTKIRDDIRATWAIAPRTAAFWQDLRYAARTLSNRPAFTAVVVLTLGLGIGANTAFFSVVNAVLLRPLRYPAADRLVLLYESFPKAHVDRLPFSALDYDDLRRDQQAFTSVAAYRSVSLEISGTARPERITAAKVSPEIFRTLGVEPALGRAFLSEDDRPGVNVAIMSWRLWRQRFGASPAIIGQRVDLDRQSYTIVGVMPAAFMFPQRGPEFNSEPADIWVPIAFTDHERIERGSNQYNSVIARLKPGVTLQAARADLSTVTARIVANYPPDIRGVFSPQLLAEPLRREVSGRFETPMWLLFAAVGLVLLVACANVANLVLIHITGRGREFAVRAALGARRLEIVRLLLCEMGVLAAGGGLVGTAVAAWAIAITPAALARVIPGLQDVAIDIRVLAFTAVVSVATAIVCTLVPLMRLSNRTQRNPLIEESSRASAGASRLRTQRAFVVATVMLTTVLLVGAGLFVRSFAALATADVGFRADHVLTASVTLPSTVYTSADSMRHFYQAASGNLSKQPGVVAATATTDFPFNFYDLRAFTAEGTNRPAGTVPMANLTEVEGRYFETFGMTLIRGRVFTADELAANRGVVVINEKLAHAAWPNDDAVGKRLKWGATKSVNPWMTVVGVIADVADGPIGAGAGAHVYEPFSQVPDFFLNGADARYGRGVKLAVRTQRAPDAMGASVRHIVAALDPKLAIDNLQSMDDQVRDVMAPERTSTVLVGMFALIALTLAAVGLYGLLAFTIAERRKEIAVRLALGAARPEVVRMVIWQGVRLGAIGLALGLASAVALGRLVASVLYRTTPYDATTFASVAVVIAATIVAASAIPAWRAARVEPITALRMD